MSSGTDDIRTWLNERMAVYLQRTPEEIDTALPLTEFGLDSLTALAVATDIEDEFSLELPPELIWNNPSIDALSAVLGGLLQKKA